MIIEMKKGAREEEINLVSARVRMFGFEAQINKGAERTVIGVFGTSTGDLDADVFLSFSGVEQVLRIQKPYKLASRDFKPDNTIVDVSGVEIGGKRLVVMAGPCSVEPNKEITLACARIAKENGAQFLRGGAFKPRTSPYAFQGLGREGLKILAEAREETGLLVVTEVMSENDVGLVAEYADLLQIGARNMKNYELLKAVSKVKRPVLLKRGEAASIEDWLCAADYVLRGNGAPNVILCHRGIVSISKSTRYGFDVDAIPVLRQLTHLPIITDPSHAAGRFQYVPSFAKMAVAGGTDGLIMEIHPQPDKAVSDGAQSLTFSDFTRIVNELKAIASAVGRSL